MQPCLMQQSPRLEFSSRVYTLCNEVNLKTDGSFVFSCLSRSTQVAAARTISFVYFYSTSNIISQRPQNRLSSSELAAAEGGEECRIGSLSIPGTDRLDFFQEREQLATEGK
ncbi:hypothetical protein NL676_027952 [Syzygium grande]|nr:hypothetical protein NL676_027952 [Syzygium grande]